MKRNLTQYTKRGAGYCAIGSTIQALEPSYYDITLDSAGVLIYLQKTLSTDTLLRLADTKSDQVIAEIEHFWTLKARFAKFGLVHKRGFLLHGPPGSGKSSTVAIVVKKMIETGGLVINGSSHTNSLKQALHDLREIEPDRPLVVTLEDIDSLLKTHELHLLSLLDGDASIDNVVFIATTNYPEKLEARIVNRPSRFDRVVRIGMPSVEARRQYILHCDPNVSIEELQSWLDLSDGFSVAQLKELIIGVRCFEHSAEETSQRLRSSSLDIPNERKIAKKHRDQSFFENFYAACAASITQEHLKKLRDAAVAIAGKPNGTEGASHV